MAVNKVVFGVTTLIDLTQLTVTPETLGEGMTALDSSGNLIVGTAKICNHTSELGVAVLGDMILGNE